MDVDIYPVPIQEDQITYETIGEFVQPPIGRSEYTDFNIIHHVKLR